MHRWRAVDHRTARQAACRRDQCAAVSSVPVLALNYLPSGIKAGTGLFQFGLAIEDEARAIARRVYADGFPRVAIVESDVDWSDARRRFVSVSVPHARWNRCRDGNTSKTRAT